MPTAWLGCVALIEIFLDGQKSVSLQIIRDPDTQTYIYTRLWRHIVTIQTNHHSSSVSSVFPTLTDGHHRWWSVSPTGERESTTPHSERGSGLCAQCKQIPRDQVLALTHWCRRLSLVCSSGGRRRRMRLVDGSASNENATVGRCSKRSRSSGSGSSLFNGNFTSTMGTPQSRH